MDEFRVEVVNVEEEAARLKEATKAAATKDKDADEANEAPSFDIPSTIQVRARSVFKGPCMSDGNRTRPSVLFPLGLACCKLHSCVLLLKSNAVS